MLKLLLLFCLYTEASKDLRKMDDFSLPIYKTNQNYTYSKEKKQVTLVNFWASWCTSCIQEIPELETLKAKYPHVKFLAINAGDSKKKIKKFLKKTNFSYTVLMDKTKTFSKGLNILSLPITIVLNSKGQFVYYDTKPPKSLNAFK